MGYVWRYVDELPLPIGAGGLHGGGGTFDFLVHISTKLLYYVLIYTNTIPTKPRLSDIFSVNSLRLRPIGML